MTEDFHGWDFNYDGRWTLGAQDPDGLSWSTVGGESCDSDEREERDSDQEESLWVIDVLPDGQFTIELSHHSLTDRNSPFPSLLEAIGYCESSDEEVQRGNKRPTKPRTRNAENPLKGETSDRDAFDWAFSPDRSWSRRAWEKTPGDSPFRFPPHWEIEVLEDGTFSVFGSHHSLTSREEPFSTLADAIAHCDAGDRERQRAQMDDDDLKATERTLGQPASTQQAALEAATSIVKRRQQKLPFE